jgi:hypothetical protein
LIIKSQSSKPLCVGYISVSKEKNKQAFLHMNGKKVQRLKWASRAGQSAAGILRQIGTKINQALYGRKDIIPSIAFGFDPDRKSYRLKNAMILADFSYLVYLEPEFVEAHIRQGGYETFGWIEDPDTDTHGLDLTPLMHLVDESRLSTPKLHSVGY